MRGFAVACALVLPGACVAATIRVPTDYATIQEAVDAAQGGDVIQIAKGTYGPFVISAKSGITLRGKGKPVVDGSGGLGAIATIADSTGIVFDRLVIQHSNDRGVLVTDSTDVTIRRSTIEQIDSDAIRAWASSGLLIEKNVIMDAGSGVDFSGEDFAVATASSVVRKNRFQDIGEAIDIDGPGHRVEKNSISDNDGTAIGLDETATNAIISKNKLANVDNAMELRGSGHVAEKNKIKGARNEGIVVVATNCRIEKNKLDGVTDDAIDLEGDDNMILKNRIRNTGDNGIELGPASGAPYPVTGNRLEKNGILKSGGHGVFISSVVSGNTLVRNRAAQSSGFDLRSEADEADNTFDKNKFKTTSFP